MRNRQVLGILRVRRFDDTAERDGFTRRDTGLTLVVCTGHLPSPADIEHGTRPSIMRPHHSVSVSNLPTHVPPF
jgi:hypothetical protein